MRNAILRRLFKNTFMELNLQTDFTIQIVKKNGFEYTCYCGLRFYRWKIIF